MEKYIPGLFIGMTAVMGLYNLFLFISTRDRNYIYYVLYIFGAGLIFLSNDGAFDDLPEKSFWGFVLGGTLFDALFFFGLVLFTQSSLETSRNAPVWHKILHLLNALSLLTVIMGWLGMDTIADNLEICIGVTGFVALTVTSLVCLRKGFRPARFFLLAHIFLSTGTILFILTHVASVLPQNSFSFYYMKTGMMLEVILSSVGLADRINLLKAENVSSQQKIIDQLTENEKLKDKVNRELEEKVAERTMELLEKNNSILDSLHYARNIQKALLPNEKYISRNLDRLNKKL
ncbi:MAG TPA: 7TM-DISM domain-containing protein [Bacteroidia bacterium]|jgi:hypothetical protein|nr:7TM-DISM domain-containing protein [Bacteroidia bacterium]